MSPRAQRRVAAGVVAACLSYLAAALAFDTRQDQGSVILALSADHGLHSGDVPVLLAWTVGMLACAWVALRDA